MLSNQVTVIGSANDYPHWADPSLINPNENVLKVIQSCVHNSGSDYYGLNANPSYRWIFLKEDLSSKNSLGKIDAVLGHGSMFEGEIQGHRYIFLSMVLKLMVVYLSLLLITWIVELTMEMRKRKIIVRIVALLLIFFAWSSYPVQRAVVMYLDVSNVKTYDFYKPITKFLPDWYLVQLLDDGNTYIADEAKSELCRRGERVDYFDRVKKLIDHQRKEVRERAFNYLQCTDKVKATDFYYQQMRDSHPSSDKYRHAMGILLANYKSADLFPYLVKYAQQPDGWNNASCVYLEEFGDPAALPVLYELREKTAKMSDDWQVRFEAERIKKAISSLEAKVPDMKTLTER